MCYTKLCVQQLFVKINVNSVFLQPNAVTHTHTHQRHIVHMTVKVDVVDHSLDLPNYATLHGQCAICCKYRPASQAMFMHITVICQLNSSHTRGGDEKVI